MIPPFNDDGRLPPGVHAATWTEFLTAFASSPGRRHMAQGLQAGLRLLALAGCRRAFIGGSFATAASAPRDIDVAWDTDAVDFERLDPVFFDFNLQRLSQKARFSSEFFPATWEATGASETYLQFFQRDRDGSQGGVSMIEMESLDAGT